MDTCQCKNSCLGERNKLKLKTESSAVRMRGAGKQAVTGHTAVVLVPWAPSAYTRPHAVRFLPATWPDTVWRRSRDPRRWRPTAGRSRGPNRRPSWSRPTLPGRWWRHSATRATAGATIATPSTCLESTHYQVANLQITLGEIARPYRYGEPKMRPSVTLQRGLRLYVCCHECAPALHKRINRSRCPLGYERQLKESCIGRGPDLSRGKEWAIMGDVIGHSQTCPWSKFTFYSLQGTAAIRPPLSPAKQLVYD